jgi:hypothetical protein
MTKSVSGAIPAKTTDPSPSYAQADKLPPMVKPKPDRREYMKRYRAANYEHKVAYDKEYARLNKAKIKARRDREAPRARARAREWYYAHREHVLERVTQWSVANPEKRKQYQTRYRKTTCACGAKKTPEAKRCRACFAQQHVQTLERKRAARLKLREKQKAKKALRYACPDCGGKKARQSVRCRRCAEQRGWDRGSKPTVRIVIPIFEGIPSCVYCQSEMYRRDWHGKAYWRCGGCGLESTLEEISRLIYEEALVA